MEEIKVRDHSKAITFVSNSPIKQMELSKTQNITGRYVAVKTEWRHDSLVHKMISLICGCNISTKVAKCLELSGLGTSIVIVLFIILTIIITFYIVSEQWSTY